MTSSVIYDWMHTWQLGIYLFCRLVFMCLFFFTRERFSMGFSHPIPDAARRSHGYWVRMEEYLVLFVLHDWATYSWPAGPVAFELVKIWHGRHIWVALNCHGGLCISGIRLVTLPLFAKIHSICLSLVVYYSLLGA